LATLKLGKVTCNNLMYFEMQVIRVQAWSTTDAKGICPGEDKDSKAMLHST